MDVGLGCRPVSAPLAGGYTAPGHSRHISGSYSSNAPSSFTNQRLTPKKGVANPKANSKDHTPHYGHPRRHTMAAVRGPGKDYENDEQWINNLCNEPPDDTETCCEGYFVPCVTYSRTQYRLKRMATDQDPLDTTEFKSCNKMCWSFYCLAGLVGTDWILVMMQHSRIRAMYNIEGSTSGDCVVAYFCTKCVLMQDEREVRAREARGNKERNKLRNDSTVITEQPRPHHDMSYDPMTLPHRGSFAELQRQEKKKSESKDDKKATDVSNRHSDSVSNNSYAGSSSVKLQKHLETTKYSVGRTAHELQSISKKGKEPIRDTTTPQQPTKPELTKDDEGNSRQSWRDRKPTVASKHSTLRAELIPGQILETPQNNGNPCRPAEEKTSEAGTLQKNALSYARHQRSNHSNTDEKVPVYYGTEDGEIPQRCRLEDCTRLRASTPGRPVTPCYEHFLTEFQTKGSQSNVPVQHLSIGIAVSATTHLEINSDIQRSFSNPTQKSVECYKVEEPIGSERVTQVIELKEIDEADKEINEADKEINEADKEINEADKEIDEVDKEIDEAAKQDLTKCADVVVTTTSPPAEAKSLDHSRYQCSVRSVSESKGFDSERATSEEPIERSTEKIKNVPEMYGDEIGTKRQNDNKSGARNEENMAPIILTVKANIEHNGGRSHKLSSCMSDELENSKSDKVENTSTAGPSHKSTQSGGTLDCTGMMRHTVECPTTVPSKANIIRKVLGDGKTGVSIGSKEILSTTPSKAFIEVGVEKAGRGEDRLKRLPASRLGSQKGSQN